MNIIKLQRQYLKFSLKYWNYTVFYAHFEIGKIKQIESGRSLLYYLSL